MTIHLVHLSLGESGIDEGRDETHRDPLLLAERDYRPNEWLADVEREPDKYFVDRAAGDDVRDSTDHCVGAPVVCRDLRVPIALNQVDDVVAEVSAPGEPRGHLERGVTIADDDGVPQVLAMPSHEARERPEEAPLDPESA